MIFVEDNLFGINFVCLFKKIYKTNSYYMFDDRKMAKGKEKGALLQAG
jgi:hypothetical protein